MAGKLILSIYLVGQRFHHTDWLLSAANAVWFRGSRCWLRSMQSHEPVTNTCCCREVAKWVRVGKARAVVVAPNIEPAEGEAGLSSLLEGILSDAAARSIPVVFALSRKRMGQV